MEAITHHLRCHCLPEHGSEPRKATLTHVTIIHACAHPTPSYLVLRPVNSTHEFRDFGKIDWCFTVLRRKRSGVAMLVHPSNKCVLIMQIPRRIHVNLPSCTANSCTLLPDFPEFLCVWTYQPRHLLIRRGFHQTDSARFSPDGGRFSPTQETHPKFLQDCSSMISSSVITAPTFS